MTIEQPNEWARYALITHLAAKLGGNQKFGKKAAQKVVYLLQQLGGVPMGFRYTFYTYGVFSSDLANMLGTVEGLGGISVDYNPGLNAYYIGGGGKAYKLLNRGQDFLDQHQDAITKIVSLAKDKTARTLELISTIVFVAKNEDLQNPYPEGELIERVKALKPQFTPEEIKSEIDGLRALGHLPDATCGF
jgi:uncharacterized protein YwgA